MKDRPAYVLPMGPSPREAIETILNAGGVPTLAHPGLLRDGEILGSLVEMGLKGLEVYYPTHTAATTRKLLLLAERYRLLPTGGSDFHGPRTGREKIGVSDVPFSSWERLKETMEET